MLFRCAANRRTQSGSTHPHTHTDFPTDFVVVVISATASPFTLPASRIARSHAAIQHATHVIFAKNVGLDDQATHPMPVCVCVCLCSKGTRPGIRLPARRRRLPTRPELNRAPGDVDDGTGARILALARWLTAAHAC